jgi:NDP-sugar pyrophosphorylase family protein
MDRERITISIKKKVLNQIDKFIDGTRIRNRSHAFETLTLLALGKSSKKSAVILMGGDNALKLIPATEKYLQKFKEAGFDTIHIAVGFLGDKIRQKLGTGEKLGLNIIYSDKGEGSGGALASLRKSIDGTFVVVNTEKFLDIDIDRLINFHRNYSPISTIVREGDSLRGLYVFDPEVFNCIPKGFSMIEEAVLTKLIEIDKAIAYPLN